MTFFSCEKCRKEFVFPSWVESNHVTCPSCTCWLTPGHLKPDEPTEKQLADLKTLEEWGRRLRKEREEKS